MCKLFQSLGQNEIQYKQLETQHSEWFHFICTTNNEQHDRPDLSSERAPQNDKTVTFKKKNNKISGQKSHIWARHQDILTDWLTVSRNVTLTLNNEQMKGGGDKRKRFPRPKSTNTAVRNVRPYSQDHSSQHDASVTRCSRLQTSKPISNGVPVYFAPRNMLLPVHKRKALEAL
jgi:hypothetical protein